MAIILSDFIMISCNSSVNKLSVFFTADFKDYTMVTIT